MPSKVKTPKEQKVVAKPKIAEPIKKKGSEKKAKVIPVAKEPESSSSSSDSSDSEEETKTKTQTTKAPVQDSSSESESEEEVKPVAKPIFAKQPVKAEPSKKDKKKAAPAPVAPVVKDDSSSSSGSDSESEEEAKPVVAKKVTDAKKEATVVAKAESSSSDSDSESEEETKATVAKTEKADSESDEESGSDASDSEMSDASEAKEEVATASKKRSAEDSEPAAKKHKLEGDEFEKAKSIFVGNLSWAVTIDDLYEFFGQFGTVLDARIATDPQTGKSRGFGYIDFETSDSATAAKAATGTDLKGREMNIDTATSKPKTGGASGRVDAPASAPSDNLFIGNLSFNSTEDSLAEIFGEYGTVSEVRMPTDRETGRKKGFGYVQFSSIDEAKAALEALNGQDVDGRSIRIDYSGAKPQREGFGGGDRGRGSRGGFGDRGGRGRGGFGDRGGRGRGARGGFGDRGGRGRGGFSDRGGRGGFGGRGRGDNKPAFSGKRTVFEE